MAAFFLISGLAVFLFPAFHVSAAASYDTAFNEEDYTDPATGRGIKVYGQCVSCSTWSYWPCNFADAASLPQCPEDYVERYYADRNTNPAVNAAPSISTVADTDLHCYSISNKHSDCSCSADIRDKEGNIFAEKESVTTGMVNTFAECEVNCSYRVCVEKGACEKSDAPVCDTPGYCQTGQGQCIELPDGTAGCKYGISSESCDADGDDCTYDSCAANPDGTGFCKAGADVCGGLVPCGRLVDNPDTDIDETADCGICSMVYLSFNVVNFLMSIVSLLTVLALIVAGLFYVKSGGNASLIAEAKQNVTRVLQGFVIVFTAWLAVNILMVVMGFSDPMGDGRWELLECRTVASRGDSATPPSDPPVPTPTPPTPTPVPTPTPTPASSTDCTVGSFNEQFLCLLNEHRQANGKNALSYNSLLNQAAMNHSIWMANNDNLSHTGEGGSSPFERCEDVGTRCDAENIAYTSSSFTPQSLFDGWKNSPGHNANMLGNHAVTGLAVYQGYATSNFY